MNWLRLNDAFHNKIAILVLVTYISMDYFAKKIEFGCMKKNKQRNPKNLQNIPWVRSWHDVIDVELLPGLRRAVRESSFVRSIVDFIFPT